ncbi:MAG: TetR/AcrR family transcriptional regulator [Pseudomonadales bacterium]|nr:TetR/AcrR family transcriptional regulator [Pseudomonadales bacterium]NRA14010.1 TetR/AcrR family transcriptional regulator [Oceanospirillaceae bacterium]
MARPRNFDKEEVLTKILHLVWKNGSTNLSLDFIAEYLKLSKTSLYSAYGNKDELISKCIELYDKEYESEMLASFKGNKISDCVNAFLAFSKQRFKSKNLPNGCFLINCSLENEKLSNRLQVQVKQSNLKFSKTLEQTIVEKYPQMQTSDISATIDMLSIILFGLASASRMNYALDNYNLQHLDQLFRDHV